MTSDLENLANEVAAADAGAQVAPEGMPQPEPSAPQATPEEDAVALVELLAGGVETAFPMLGYTEETKARAARKLAPLLAKYGGLGMGRWAVEIDAGLFFGGVVIASFRAVRAAKQEQESKQAQPEAGDGGK